MQLPGPFSPRCAGEKDRVVVTARVWRAALSGSVGPAHPATPLRGSLLLVQATPGPVFLRPGDGVTKAVHPNWATSTDGLCLALTYFPFGLPFPVGAEEEEYLFASARGGILPGPVWPRRHGHLPTYLRHESVSSAFPYVLCQPSGFLTGHAAFARCGNCPVLPSNAP